MATATTTKFVLTSPVFKEGEMIPKKFGYKEANISPPLEWRDVPPQVKSLTLLVEDPDAPMGTWIHWVIFDIPPSAHGLKEHVPTDKTLPDGAIQGKNDFGDVGYGGPVPPSGTHRYFFKLYALDITLKLQAGSTKPEVMKAMQGHILGEAELIGRYAR